MKTIQGVYIPSQFRDDVNRALAARERLKNSGFDPVIAAWRRILERPGIQNEPLFWGVVQHELGQVLQKRFETVGDSADIDAALALYQQALTTTQLGSACWWGVKSEGF